MLGKLLKGQYGWRVKCTLLLDIKTIPILEVGKVRLAQGQGANRQGRWNLTQGYPTPGTMCLYYGLPSPTWWYSGHSILTSRWFLETPCDPVPGEHERQNPRHWTTVSSHRPSHLYSQLCANSQAQGLSLVSWVPAFPDICRPARELGKGCVPRIDHLSYAGLSLSLIKQGSLWQEARLTGWEHHVPPDIPPLHQISKYSFA